MEWQFGEPTLRTTPESRLGVYATATDGSGSAALLLAEGVLRGGLRGPVAADEPLRRYIEPLESLGDVFVPEPESRRSTFRQAVEKTAAYPGAADFARELIEIRTLEVIPPLRRKSARSADGRDVGKLLHAPVEQP
jgi:hypothetical protein